VFNIACGERYTLINLVNLINEFLTTNIQPIFDKARLGDVSHSLASIQKAKTKLNLIVDVGFKEGLAKLISAAQD
ncbi:MAG: LPS biosynthesis protein WbpP, partial [Bacteroidota bacterium]